MKSFLVDVNLPKLFSFFNYENFYHVCDINPRMPDTEIWNYALENNYIILSKDVDFYTRIITSDEKAKVIFFNLGNIKLNELHQYFEKNWSFLNEKIDDCYLIVAEKDKIRLFY